MTETRKAKAIPRPMTRRQILTGGLQAFLAANVLPRRAGAREAPGAALRAINIVNFLRAEEPRESVDLLEPAREQMRAICAHGLPATWLLQYDALVEGPFVEFLKTAMPESHEVGLWFEMNQRICQDAGIPWRGDPAWEWDYHVPVAYAIGYPPEDRRKLAATAMATFRRVFGHEARSVACWNLDAVSLAYLAEHYPVDAFANCRDQLATDGFTIWGAPIAGYYPSRINAWSPALDRMHQISTPVFRLLGQDPVYYYDNTLPYPDTMEPVWPSGQNERFIDQFLGMIEGAPTQAFAYAQVGQENSFGWPKMRAAYALQMAKLDALRRHSSVVLETMGETGRRFKRAFPLTPPQAQVMVSDPFAKQVDPQRTVWYQSRFYRANLHFAGDLGYLRDLHVYHDAFAQPYLEDVATLHGIEQRMLAVLDGYHWSDDQAQAGDAQGLHAMGRLFRRGPDGSETPLRVRGPVRVTETAATLETTVALWSGGHLTVAFDERGFDLRVDPMGGESLVLVFEWVPSRSALRTVREQELSYRFREFDYGMRIEEGVASPHAHGARIAGNGPRLRLMLAQDATGSSQPQRASKAKPRNSSGA